jgi:hypothetical protein
MIRNIYGIWKIYDILLGEVIICIFYFDNLYKFMINYVNINYFIF